MDIPIENDDINEEDQVFVVHLHIPALSQSVDLNDIITLSRSVSLGWIKDDDREQMYQYSSKERLYSM